MKPTPEHAHYNVMTLTRIYRPRMMCVSICLMLIAVHGNNATAKQRNASQVFDAITGAATPSVPATEPAATPATTLQRLSDYLNGLNTLRAEFIQTDEEGNRETGTFFLKRPSQARWEYHPPSPLMLIANAGFLSIIDTDLEEVRNIPAENALSSVLSAENIDLSAVDGVVTMPPRQVDGRIHVTLRKKGAGHDGSLTLRFNEAKNGAVTLAGFTQLDAAGRTTDITFTELFPNVEVHKSQFDVPAFRSNRRR